MDAGCWNLAKKSEEVNKDCCWSEPPYLVDGIVLGWNVGVGASREIS